MQSVTASPVVTEQAKTRRPSELGRSVSLRGKRRFIAPICHHVILTARLLSYGQYLTRAFSNQIERTTREAIPETIRSEV
jgi:hypothetical protein